MDPATRSLFSIYQDGDGGVWVENPGEAECWRLTCYAARNGCVDLEMVYDNVRSLWVGVVILE